MKIKNKITATLVTMLLLLAVLCPGVVCAADRDLINDFKLLLPEAERAGLNDYAITISEKYGLDVAFFLAPDTYANTQTLQEYAQEIYANYRQLGANGFMVAVDEAGGVWDFVAFGQAQAIVTEAMAEDFMAAYESDDTYYGGIISYLQAVDASLGEIFYADAAGTSIVPDAGPRALADGEQWPLFVDQVGVVDSQQAQLLLDRLNAVSAKHNFDTVIAVVPEIDQREARVFAADFYEGYSFGQGAGSDGAILLLATESRDFGFATFGAGMKVFTPAGQDYLDKLFLPQLKKDQYFESFMSFADAVDDFLVQAQTGEPYNSSNIPLTADETGKYRGIAATVSLLFSGLISFFVTGRWKGQLKSVRQDHSARSYVRAGSMVLAVQDDIMLHQKVDKVRRKDSDNGNNNKKRSTFTSSSGKSSSGHSGKF